MLLLQLLCKASCFTLIDTISIIAIIIIVVVIVLHLLSKVLLHLRQLLLRLSRAVLDKANTICSGSRENGS